MFWSIQSAECCGKSNGPCPKYGLYLRRATLIKPISFVGPKAIAGDAVE